MLASCSRVAGRRCQRLLAETTPSVTSQPQSFLQNPSQQQWRHSTLSHVAGLRRPKRAAIMDEALDMSWDNHSEPARVAASSSSGLAKANKELSRFATYHRIGTVFSIARRMKEDEILPDRTTYDNLLSVCAAHATPSEAWAILEDMASVGIEPDRSAFHHVIGALEAREMRGTWELLQVMQHLNVEPDATTFDLIITRVLKLDNVELALQYLALMSDRGMVPLGHTTEAIVRACCKLSMPRLAWDLAVSFEAVSPRRLDGHVWMECLLASAETLYVEGVRDLWQKCVHELNMIPDEGCCIHVLNVAARAGEPQLALDVIRTLQLSRIVWEEYHFAPLVEAFCKNKDLKQAVEVLGTMQDYKVTPDAGTAYPIFHTIATAARLDLAWQAADKVREEGKVVDVTALNAILRGAVKLKDLQRALGIYSVYSDFKASPNIDTFNILLAGCIATAHRQLGDRLLTEMKTAGIKPDAVTFQRTVILCLTQPTYEDAFFYLEEMKKEGFVPSRSLYENIIRKCVLAGDPRHKLALEEMLSQGHEVSATLEAFVNSGGEVVSSKVYHPVSDVYASTHPPRRRGFRVPDVPGPNAYDTHDPEYDVYKRGAFLETADRFQQDKPSDVPGPGGRITPDPSKNPNTAKPTKGASADRYALLQRKVEELERIHHEGKKSVSLALVLWTLARTQVVTKHLAEVDRLKQELNRTQKSNSEQTERYDKLKKQSELLESRLQETKKLHDSSQAEAKDLRVKLRFAEHEKTQLASKQGEAGEMRKAMQALEGKRRDEVRERDKKIADLEKANAVEKKKRELLEAKLSEISGTVHARSEQAKARARELEEKLQEVQSDASRTTASFTLLKEKAGDTERELLGQLEQHRQMMSRVAEEYGSLASSSVPKDQHDSVKLDLITSQLRVNRLDRKLANSENQVRDLAQLIRQNRDQNQLLREHLKEAESTVAVYSSALKSTLKERPEDPSVAQALRDDFASLQRGHLEAELTKERILTTDATVWADLCSRRSDWLLLNSAFLVKHLDERDKQVQHQSAELSAAKAKHDNLQTSLAALQSESDGLRVQLLTSVANLAEANGRLEVLKKERVDVETRLKANFGKVEQTLSQEKEANKRLASTVQKGRQAEEALQAELEQLTTQLVEAEQYQYAYENLLDEVESLVQRNALAEEETQRLSKFNAEIVGHNNPAQRVVYVDRIRRELHETKQQILVLQRDRDAVAYENDDLRHELGLYKSVAVPTDYKAKGHVTRVGRTALGDQNLNVKPTNATSGGEDMLNYLPEEYREGDLTVEEIM
ncbi:hypothetical protein EUX98_g903 [Antrodiella citrinella]|uniref:Pentatricopeptide repeat-containing protein-mitochondrial domain-containing protein n=1 Tax=Antrodiella citrinella TaxID=2447956 RepID=A0A4S4N5V2_9APHY|nr:hypothetical protein EUX98_g903 [Antrodiella citrinella]